MLNTLADAFSCEKSFYKKMYNILLPVALQNLIVFSLSVIDIVFLGFVGQNEISAATLANAPFFIIILTIFGFQSGSSILINQYWGRKNTTAISRVMGITFMTAFAIGFMASLLAFFFPETILKLYTNDQTLREIAAQYMRIVAFSYTICIPSQVYTTALRSTNQALVGMYISLVGMISNIILNSILIFGLFGFPKMGIAGAALGTLFSRIVELIVTIIIIKKNKHFRIDFTVFFKPGIVITRDFFKYGGPVVANETLWGLGTSMYTAIYGRLGTDIVAAFSIASNINRVFSVFAAGFGSAAIVILGKEIGSGEVESAKKHANAILTLTTLLAAAIAIILFFLRSPIVHLFSIPEHTRTLAKALMLIYIVRFPLFSYNHSSIVGVLRAGGDAKTAMVIDLISLWICGILLTAIFAFVLNLPLIAIFIPLFIEEVNKYYWSSRRIKSGKWINNITKNI